jgi:uncharacterized protein (DUF2164 family)
MRISSEKKDVIREHIKEFFYQEHSEEIGDLAADNFLDFISKEIGPFFYNQGVQDAKALCEQKMISLEEDIQSLERPIKGYRG